MSVRLSVHLTFDGRCREAFVDYQRILGGTLDALLTYGDSPMAGEVAPDWRDKIVHATLTLPGGQTLLGADAPPPRHEKPRGFYVLVGTADAGEAARVFGALAEGGVVHLPLQRTFWSPAFGVVVDRFDVPWEVSCDG